MSVQHPSWAARAGLLTVPGLLLALSVLSLSAPLSGCEEPPPPEPFRVSFAAECEGEPVEGVEIRVDGLNQADGSPEVYYTRANGIISVDIVGEVGISREARAVCPNGYRSPEHPKLITLRRISGLSPEAVEAGQVLGFECLPTHRVAALVVYTQGQGDLPVYVEGEQVATTDENGFAHAVFSVEPNTTVRVRVDTEEYPRVQPQNPRRTYPIADSDRVLQFHEEFRTKRAPRGPRRGPRPTGPAPRMLPTPI